MKKNHQFFLPSAELSQIVVKVKMDISKRYHITAPHKVIRYFFFLFLHENILWALIRNTSPFSTKTYVVGTHYKHFPKVLLKSTNNMCSWRKLSIFSGGRKCCDVWKGLYTQTQFCLLRADITKTCLYNFDPLKPHFYIVKLGFTGAAIIFLISVQSIDCGYSLEPPHRGGSNEYPQSMFCAEMWKIWEFFTWKFSFFWW